MALVFASMHLYNKQTLEFFSAGQIASYACPLALIMKLRCQIQISYSNKRLSHCRAERKPFQSSTRVSLTATFIAADYLTAIHQSICHYLTSVSQSKPQFINQSVSQKFQCRLSDREDARWIGVIVFLLMNEALQRRSHSGSHVHHVHTELARLWL